MEQAWRWFGPEEPTTLNDVTQTGATGIVTALHHVKYGEVWSVDEIMTRKSMIEADPALGLRWSVVESLQIPEAIKLGESGLEPMFEKYRQSIRNLAQCGIETICYNFMTVQDWMRTEHSYPLPGGARALRFNAYEYAAFDCFILKRKGAENDQKPEVLDDCRGRSSVMICKLYAIFLIVIRILPRICCGKILKHSCKTLSRLPKNAALECVFILMIRRVLCWGCRASHAMKRISLLFWIACRHPRTA